MKKTIQLIFLLLSLLCCIVGCAEEGQPLSGVKRHKNTEPVSDDRNSTPDVMVELSVTPEVEVATSTPTSTATPTPEPTSTPTPTPTPEPTSTPTNTPTPKPTNTPTPKPTNTPTPSKTETPFWMGDAYFPMVYMGTVVIPPPADAPNWLGSTNCSLSISLGNLKADSVEVYVDYSYDNGPGRVIVFKASQKVSLNKNGSGVIKNENGTFSFTFRKDNTIMASYKDNNYSQYDFSSRIFGGLEFNW